MTKRLRSRLFSPLPTGWHSLRRKYSRYRGAGVDLNGLKTSGLASDLHLIFLASGYVHLLSMEWVIYVIF